MRTRQTALWNAVRQIEITFTESGIDLILILDQGIGIKMIMKEDKAEKIIIIRIIIIQTSKLNLQRMNKNTLKSEQKNKKLLQFRDKLAKMNGYSSFQQQRNKLQEIANYSDILSKDIEFIVKEIDDFYKVEEERIMKMVKEMIICLENSKVSMIQQLTHLKDKQLEVIKDDLDSHKAYQKKATKFISEFEKMGKTNQDLTEGIKSLGVYTTKPLHDKIQVFRSQREEVRLKIYKIEKLTKEMALYMQQNLSSQCQNRVNQKVKDKTFEQKHQYHNGKQEGGKKTIESRRKETWPEEDLLKSRDNDQKFEQAKKTLFNKRSIDCHQASEENLMSDLDQKQYYQRYSNKKDKGALQEYLQSCKSEEKDEDDKTEKHGKLKKHKAPANNLKNEKLSRKQSQPVISHFQVEKSLKSYIMQLKKNSNQISRDISSRQQVSTPNQNFNEITKPIISRVKSQENCIYLTKSRPTLNSELKLQFPKTTQNSSSKNFLGITRPQRQNSSGRSGGGGGSGLRDPSNSSRKGNWMAILKQQQIKYNEMKKKLKN